MPELSLKLGRVSASVPAARRSAVTLITDGPAAGRANAQTRHIHSDIQRPALTVIGVDQETAAALSEMVELADTFPGQFKPEFELGYSAGVAEGADRWYVRFEGDIRENEFTVTGRTAAEALRMAMREAQGRIP